MCNTSFTKLLFLFFEQFKQVFPPTVLLSNMPEQFQQVKWPCLKGTLFSLSIMIAKSRVSTQIKSNENVHFSSLGQCWVFNF